MKITLSNNILVENPSKELIDYCYANMVVDNPEYKSRERYGYWLGNTPEYLYLFAENGSDLILPSGFTTRLWKDFANDLSTNQWINNIPPVQKIDLKSDVKLRDYQERAVNALVKAKRGILEAPCGSGKTQIGLALIQRLGVKALWLTHTKKLMCQSLERAKQLFPDGRYACTTEGQAKFGEDITFATVQTMSKLETYLYKDAFSMIIVDECHHCIGSPTQTKMFWKVVNNCNCRYKYGLSATIKRNDGMQKAMFLALGDLAYTVSKSDVASVTMKAVTEVVKITKYYNESDYLGSDGMLDFNALLETLTCDRGRNSIIVEKVLEMAKKGLQQLILTHRVAHVKELVRLLRQRGLDVAEIYGKVKEGDRDYYSPVIVATYYLAKEGLDIPTLAVVHFATPIKDAIAVKQCAGRVERVATNKKDAIVIDYVDENIPYCAHARILRKRILK